MKKYQFFNHRCSKFYFVILLILSNGPIVAFAQENEQFPNSIGNRWVYHVKDYRLHRQDSMVVKIVGESKVPSDQPSLRTWQYHIRRFYDTQYVQLSGDTAKFLDRSRTPLKMERVPLVVGREELFINRVNDSVSTVKEDTLTANFTVNGKRIINPKGYHVRQIYVVPSMTPMRQEIITDEFYVTGVGLVRKAQSAFSGNKETKLADWELISATIREP
jgi:hypothetical protein